MNSLPKQTFNFCSLHQLESATEESHSKQQLSKLNKTSLHLCVALYHSLCNHQGNMFEQRAINPIYYTLSSNPGTCAVKPGLPSSFPAPN